MFFVVKREENRQKNDNWNIWIWVFLSENGRFVTHNCFSKIGVLKPLFYSVLGVRVFWAKLSKKGIFGDPPKTKKFLTDN